MKRFFAIALVLLMIVALVGCGSEKRKPIELTLSTEDAVAIMEAAGIRLPPVEEAAGAGSTVVWFSWYDPFQNYTEDEMVNTGYYTFRHKYNGEIKWDEVVYEERFTLLATRIVGGTTPDLFPAGVGADATFPMRCINDTFLPIDDYIDYTDPLWADMAEAAEYYSLGDIHYGIVTELAPRTIVPYNRRVVREHGFDDPAELYWNDEWTMDHFYDMCMEFSDPDEDRYALQGYTFHDDLVQVATGEYYILQAEGGLYYSNLDSPMLEIASNKVADLLKNQCSYPQNLRGGVSGTGVKDGLCLFEFVNFSAITGPVDEIGALWGDVKEEELMFVPIPRYTEGDGYYYLNAVPSGYMLVSGSKNPDGAVLLASCVRFKLMDPTVVRVDEKQLKQIYLWTDEMLEMYKECYKIVADRPRMYRQGNFIDNLTNTYNHIRDDVKTDTSSTWALRKEKYGEQLDYYIQEQNDIISNYIAGLAG